MTMGDVNAILRAYLETQEALTDIVSTHIYCPRLPEGASLPALAFFVRGGTANPYTKLNVEPSFQFDCWGDSPIEARSVYCALYEVLQGMGGYYAASQPVVVDGTTYYILATEEEVQGQDIQGVDIPNYHRVVTFFRVKIKIGG